MVCWNPDDYARYSAGQESWARELLEQLALKADDAVLDIGCGDGRQTARIAARVPEGHVLGVDSSPDMVAYAQGHHGGGGAPNLRFERADASSLPYEDAFSVVFSNAALHWVVDHRPVLRGIRRALRPGGRALLQMGGHGNGAAMKAVFARVQRRPRWADWFRDFVLPYGFHSPDDYRHWATEAGLEVVEARLIPKDMPHEGRDGLLGWLRTAWLPYTAPLPAPSRAAFLDEVADAYLAEHSLDKRGRAHVDMVRLQVRLHRP